MDDELGLLVDDPIHSRLLDDSNDNIGDMLDRNLGDLSSFDDIKVGLIPYEISLGRFTSSN